MGARISILSAASILVVESLAVHAADPDPYAGTFKLNLAESTYEPASMKPKESSILEREATADGYKQTTVGVSPQGDKTHVELIVKLDGKEYPVTGSPDFDTVAKWKTKDNAYITVNKKNGGVTRMMRAVFSGD